jgi:hypothetical protein
MTVLLKGERLDLGDGLAIELRASVFNNDYKDTPTEMLEFDCFVEGEDVGSVDHTLGGCIVPVAQKLKAEQLQADTGAEYVCYLPADDADEDVMWQLFDAITIRISELFPSMYNDRELVQ